MCYTFTKKYIPLIGVFILFLVINKVSHFIYPLIIGKFIDNIFEGMSQNMLFTFAQQITVIAVSAVLSLYVSSITRAKFFAKITFDFINSVVEIIKRLPLKFFDDIDLVYLNKRITDDVSILTKFYTLDVIELSMSVILMGSMLFLISQFNVFFLVLMICIFALNIIGYFVCRPILYKKGYLLQETQSMFFSKVSDQFNIIKTIKRQVWFKVLNKEIVGKYNDLYKASIDFEITNAIYDSLEGVFKFIAIIVFGLFGGNQIINGTLTIGELVVVYTYSNIILGNVGTIMNFGKSYQRARVAYDRLDEIFSMKSEHNGQLYITSITNITVRNLSFGYQDNQEIISDVNCCFEKGKVYQIVGGNGRGKTTFLDLLVGMRYDYSGNILYNNQDIRDLDMYKLREKMIGYVEQEPVLSKNSLEVNLTYGLDNYDKTRLDKYLNSFEIQNLLSNSDKRDMTIVSGGEKQKIALTRVLIKESELVILDEPLSAIDKKAIGEFEKIMNELKENAIVIIITHNEALTPLVDETITL